MDSHMPVNERATNTAQRPGANSIPNDVTNVVPTASKHPRRPTNLAREPAGKAVARWAKSNDATAHVWSDRLIHADGVSFRPDRSASAHDGQPDHRPNTKSEAATVHGEITKRSRELQMLYWKTIELKENKFIKSFLDYCLDYS